MCGDFIFIVTSYNFFVSLTSTRRRFLIVFIESIDICTFESNDLRIRRIFKLVLVEKDNLAAKF